MNTWTSVCRGSRSPNIRVGANYLCLPADFQVSLLKKQAKAEPDRGEIFIMSSQHKCIHFV